MFRRNEHGMVLPTRLLALSVSAVAAAVLVYVVNDPDQPNSDRATPTTATETAPHATGTPSPSVAPSTKASPTAKPFKRGKIMVEIFNNTRTKGLAGHTAATATAAGWKVIGTDNWYGTVTTTTVYYPPKLEAAARALGRDLGIHKVRPAEDPMHFDRITVILTDDFHG